MAIYRQNWISSAEEIVMGDEDTVKLTPEEEDDVSYDDSEDEQQDDENEDD